MKQFFQQYGDYVIEALSVILIVAIVNRFGANGGLMYQQFETIFDTFNSKVNLSGAGA